MYLFQLTSLDLLRPEKRHESGKRNDYKMKNNLRRQHTSTNVAAIYPDPLQQLPYCSTHVRFDDQWRPMNLLESQPFRLGACLHQTASVVSEAPR